MKDEGGVEEMDACGHGKVRDDEGEGRVVWVDAFGARQRKIGVS